MLKGEKYQRLKDWLLTFSVCILCIFFAQILRQYDAPDESLCCIYILGVVLVSYWSQGYIYGASASVFLAVSYFYFITAPVMAFAHPTLYNILTTGLMLIISLLISSITSKVKTAEIQARRREERSQVLYRLTKDLAGVSSLDEVINLTLFNIHQTFNTDCRLLLFDENGKPQENFVLYENGIFNPKAPTDQTRTFEEYQKPKSETGYFVTSTQYEWPFYSPQGKIIGAIAIPATNASMFTEQDFRTINTMIETAAIVFDKIVLETKQEESRMVLSQERYKTNLLRSISHDLRTPLAGISGTCEVLMEMLPENSKEYDLAASISKETSWLFTLVQNVLSLTRLQNGQVDMKKEVMVVEDVVNSAVETMNVRLPSRPIQVVVPEDVLAAQMDSALIKQVLINLIDNANKYSKNSTPIEVEVKEAPDSGQVEVSVSDHGIGLSPAAIDKVFKMFYTTKSTAPGALRGFGLGLPICDSIMKAHGGTIKAGNRTDGQKGAVFTITLPKYSF